MKSGKKEIENTIFGLQESCLLKTSDKISFITKKPKKWPPLCDDKQVFVYIKQRVLNEKLLLWINKNKKFHFFTYSCKKNTALFISHNKNRIDNIVDFILDLTYKRGI